MKDEKEQKEENVPVSARDELTIDSAEPAERNRPFGEYKATNTPLPAVEVDERAEHGWTPRRLEDIHDLQPIPEHEPPTGEHRG